MESSPNGCMHYLASRFQYRMCSHFPPQGGPLCRSQFAQRFSLPSLVPERTNLICFLQCWVTSTGTSSVFQTVQLPDRLNKNNVACGCAQVSQYLPSGAHSCLEHSFFVQSLWHIYVFKRICHLEGQFLRLKFLRTH